ncbi:heterokaryon incompatibility protein-domain-containing protein [Triangularia setosa]|uniref:Heterokaryon incompatibility protein-domain-containing protein n=1 Tax=Triangularia setosa TaxID=2587417 RepID=A0AAN7A3Q6_9PEZI|nr:heterokaryon incompatibility protein-domain-containing protein [Podospora setosa]
MQSTVLRLFSERPRQSLCLACTNRGVLSPEPCRESFADVESSSKNCELHKIVHGTFLATIATGVKTESTFVEIQRIGSHLFLNRMPDPCLSLYLGLGKLKGLQLPGSGEAADEIQIGLPTLLPTTSLAYFDLLADWLKDCDTNHPDCYLKGGPVQKRAILPTRVLDLGTAKDTASRPSIWLRLSDSLALKREDTRYIALSHPWGESHQHDHFSTTATNVSSRLTAGIAISRLPKTFRDAVTITRALGIRYLWIDSLCIVQGPRGDFETEAQKMETVFSMAYCVIAASRAKGTSSGFLSPRPARKFVALNLDASTGEGSTGVTEEDASNMIYVCETIDNFQADVIDGPLNKRGWVLQERALARRTIYFTERQTYFECGAGVRCETLAKMTNNQSSFLGDPNFPQVALASSKGGKIRLYESLYKTYSRLQFTRACDRPIAIAGLEQRLVAAFYTRGGYGIFDRVPFFGRSLLWTCEEPGGMKRIEFPKEGLGRYRVPPSWSWMAHTGAISFMDLPFEGVHWLEDEVRSPWGAAVWEMNLDTTESRSSTASSMWHTGRTDQENNLTGRGRRLVVKLKTAEEKIKWDAGKRPASVVDGKHLRVVAVGRRKSKGNKPAMALEHHVLVVVGIGGMTGSGGRRTYERVGAGSLPGSWITHDEHEEEIAVF